MFIKRPKPKLENYCVMFFPQQEKHVIFKIYETDGNQLLGYSELDKHFSLSNGEFFLAVNVEATSTNQAFSIGSYKLGELYEKTLCGGSETDQQST